MITQENIPYTADEIKAMVKTCEKYNEALERARKFNNGESLNIPNGITLCEYLFPELKESEDELTRKSLIRFLKSPFVNENITDEKVTPWIAWLEKQGKQKPTDKTTPKFKVGDWIVTDDSFGKIVRHVDEISDNIIDKGYVVSDENGLFYNISFDKEHKWHKWTIKDAKDGDLIYVSTETKGIQAIFHKFENGIIYFHCNLCSDFAQGGYEPSGDVKSVNPLLREQYQSFFKNMKQAGYEWDQKEKKLIKMKETKFKVGDWIIDINPKYNSNIFYVSKVLENIYKLINIDGDNYHQPHYNIDEHFHLWTIQDAKDGDVLVNGSNIFIFHFINDTRLMGYCHMNIDDGRFYDDIGKKECFCLIDAVVTPAAKEQRDLLFSKMNEAKYEWDAEKKELKKIEVASKETEDERKRKAILTGLIDCRDAPDLGWSNFGGINIDECIAWLEKQKDYIKLPGSTYTSNKDVIEFADKYSHNVWEKLMDKFKKNENYSIGCNDVSDLVLNAIINTYNWLEKQGEKKTADMVEPKFKVGDWIVSDEGIFKITRYEDECGYELTGTTGYVAHFVSSDYVESNYHLWTIQDAKDGDVLHAHECVVLFKEIDGLNIKCHCTYHYMNNPSFYVNTLQNKKAFRPATKEQRDMLFQQMKEAGYEWDAEKKELKKIEVASKESKDERIRKTIYGWIYTQPSEFFDYGFSKEEMLAWLEKQGHPKMLNADEVVGWLDKNLDNTSLFTDLIVKFVADFRL